ncbi:hypothetical protein FDG09_01500 [Clostridium sporogenes]|uniref:hypothetical protein n=1 Tax=Clostridium sporogenes TaxID=1509 RepID=UPI0013D37B09|nr:hypothetical protein [Clostridium sporogenes]NFV11637.1 hypothetical protein [Clostridium sporogenes]
MDEIEKGINSNNYEKVCDRKEAIIQALNIAQEGDMVIILGRGHENTQKIKQSEIPFNDKTVTEQLLADIGYRDN